MFKPLILVAWLSLSTVVTASSDDILNYTVFDHGHYSVVVVTDTQTGDVVDAYAVDSQTGEVLELLADPNLQAPYLINQPEV